MKLVSQAFLIPLTLVVAGSVFAAAPQTDDPYVGNQMCIRCHEDVQKALVDVPHGSGNASAFAEKGCQSCHGPGRPHVQNPNDADRQPSVERMTRDQQSQLCNDCHGDIADFNRTHTSETISCSGCHVIHVREGAVGIISWQKNCIACHSGQQMYDELHAYDEANMASGKVSCRSCHQQAHGSLASEIQ